MSTQTISTTFTVSFAPSALACAPDLSSAIIRISGVANVASDPAVEALLAAAEASVRDAGLTRDSISALPSIAAWRGVYARFGAKPNRSLCAAEALLRRVATAGPLPRINALVDLCNAVSLRSQIPIAACDIARVVGGMTIRQAAGSEQYLPLGAPEQPEQPDPGEVIYADEAGMAHSRRWNWRQSDLIKTTTDSSELILTVEAAHAGARPLVEQTTAQLLELIRPLVNGRIDAVLLDADRPGYTFV